MHRYLVESYIVSRLLYNAALESAALWGVWVLVPSYWTPD